MCNLYSQRKPKEELRGLFRISGNRIGEITDQPAIFPRTNAPVIRRAEDGEREVVHMSWGFMLLRQGYAPKPVTNVRDDQILTNKFWRPSFEERRCLVPATSFCEPNGDVKPATWHWFALRGDDPRPLFALPGIWRRYRGPLKKGGETVELDTYSFLTTTPNPLVATINHERMPVLLTKPEDFDQWLAGTPKEALELAREFPAEGMHIVRQGFEKEDALLQSGPSNGPAAPTLF